MAARTTTRTPPATREIVTAHVLAAEPLGASFVRVTVGGDGLARFAPMGFDQWFRMFLPGPGRHAPTLPGAADHSWWPQMQAMPEQIRPILRNYTVRDYREAGCGRYGPGAELVVDVATHGDTGPASAWARTAEPGAALALLDEGIMFHRPAGATWQIVVGDESALPAIAGILAPSAERNDATVTEVFVEVSHLEDVAAQNLVTGPRTRVHPVTRTDVRPGAQVLDAVRAAELPDGPGYGFVVGESGLVTAMRRHLVRERGLEKSAVTFSGYWKYGAAAY